MPALQNGHHAQGDSVNHKLQHIQNWPELARQANWSVARLAKLSGITRRTLHRHFIKKRGQTPKSWLEEQGQKLAIELLRDGFSVKETAAQLGYACSETFSRNFKRRCGKCPMEVALLMATKPTTISNVPISHEMSRLVGLFPLKPIQTLI